MGWQGKKDGFMGENCISGAFMIVKNYKNILLDQSYNDLGFQVGSRLVVLVEAQASLDAQYHCPLPDVPGPDLPGVF